VIGVLLAVPDCPQETDLVAGAAGHGLRILRRCVDASDLLAAAAADPASAVVLSAALPRLSRDAVDRLGGGSGRHVVGLVSNDEAEQRLVGLGVTQVVGTGPSAAATLMELRDVLSGATAPMRHEEPGVWATGGWTPGRGTIVAVWGPMGAPGRTTVATGVAESLAESGRRVCVVDADTYAPSVAMALGVIEDSSGLLVACRHADNGSLTASSLAGLTRRVGRDLHLLGGLTRPQRWPDLRPTALERVWDTCRETFDVTVIDIGFCVEDADGSAPWSRQRNAAALTALGAADRMIAVADASGAGAARLAAAWPSISERLPAKNTIVVRNRARGGGRQWLEALRTCGITADVHSLPADERAVMACWERGRSLGEGAPRSRIRRSLVELAGVAVSG
jgi:Mrp family chromosome partitioning ATPase